MMDDDEALELQRHSSNGCSCSSSEEIINLHSYDSDDITVVNNNTATVVTNRNINNRVFAVTGAGVLSNCKAPVRRRTNFFPTQSYIVGTAGEGGVVRAIRQRKIKHHVDDAPFQHRRRCYHRNNQQRRQSSSCSTVFVFVLCCCLCLVRSSTSMTIAAAENTLDMLRDEPGMSAAQISEKIIQCNESRLCTNFDDNEPVCGSDGRTYNSLCEIKKAICHGSPVKEQYKGPCSDKSKCGLERAFQLELSEQHNRTALFIPECEPDGSYSMVQCHTLGYCWCATSNGRPIPGTSVQLKKPNCLPQGKVGRRSSRRRLGTRRRVCSSADRSTFSSNLIKLFRSEFEQDPQNKRRSADSSSLTDLVIKWKFNNLDTDHNNKISRNEIRTLKKLTESLVQPKSCAKRFPKYCDQDNDKKLSRSEWSICLEVDINMSFRILLSLNQNRPQASSAMMNDRANQQQYNDSMVGGLHMPPSFLTNPGGSNSPLGLHDSPLVQTDSHEEEEKIDCKSHRQRAIEENLRTPNSAVFIPTCQPPDEKLYDIVQCHELTGYCWCSEPDTGRPIAQTTQLKMRPNCTNRTKIINEFKGCNSTKKRQFYTRLWATLESSMIASGKGDYVDEISRKEMAVRWQFSQLDKNNNDKLDRREWRNYRNELKSWKGVRKCGRNFLRFCDQNTDKRITMQEWLDCTVTIPSRPSTVRGRKGQNPFTSILNSD